jgi:hypothetical protein
MRPATNAFDPLEGMRQTMEANLRRRADRAGHDMATGASGNRFMRYQTRYRKGC